MGLSSEQLSWLTNPINDQAEAEIYAYLEYSNATTGEFEYSADKVTFTKQLIDLIIEENKYSETGNSSQANIALKITLSLLNTNNISNFGTANVDTLIQNQLIPINPGYGAFGIMAKYNALVIQEAAIIMGAEYPANHQFTKFEIAKVLFQAQSEALHMGLDILGMAPVVGPIFDVTNGVWYTFSGDFANAGLSYTAVIPFVGDWTTVARITKRIYSINNGVNKVILKAYKMADGSIKFSNRNQLRKILGITNISVHAHHVIPFGLTNEPLIQLAAKFSSITKKAWHPNDIANGIPMPADFHLNGHSIYSNKIKARMTVLFNQANGDMELAYDLLTDYMNDIKDIIAANPNLTLGEIANLIP